MYARVSEKTLLHHIKEPWTWPHKKQAYYFCDDPTCDVVYFGQDDTIIDKMGMKAKPGTDAGLQDSLICYCFGISYKKASTKPELKQFVIDKTKNNLCACEVKNPSGQCCLKNFPA
ncbi:MAG: hypothetical protein KZQ90_01380 [Candidatus Thiodiazotropha sp. (ex Codakia rugifera)]|nr:hypothetical protein [Candidatus Thiodiazotropha sp. (ex Codakia rugifera)]